MCTGLEIAFLAMAGTSAVTTGYGIIESRKASKKAEKELEKKEQEARDIKAREEAADKEKRLRLHRKGSQLPKTILTGGFSGAKGPAQIKTPNLLGI